MPLNDLNRELYSSHADEVAKRTHEQSSYDPTFGINSKASPFDEQQQWNAPQKGLSPVQKRNLWIGVAVFTLVLLTIGGVVFYQWWVKNAFHQDRVSITFEGPKEADSTQPMKYIVHYANKNRVTLKNAEIQLSYPENFQPTENLNLKYLSPTASKVFLGDIKPMTSGQTELNGIFYAPKDFPVYLRGEIHFVPSNGTTELVMDNQMNINITAAPVTLNIAAPQQVVDGDGLEYVIEYKNLDAKRISDMQVKIEFPQGFEMTSSQPKVSEAEKSASWYIGNMEANQSGRINIQGVIKGGTSDGKKIVVLLGRMGDDNQFVVYDRQELLTRIVSPVLTVSQHLERKTDNIVNAGELLSYVITFQNTGSVGLRDAIVTAEVSGSVLDFSKINVENGFYDGSKKMAIWKASDVPALANINPGSSGTVRFSIPIKAIIPVENKLSKNFVISSIAKIDSPDIPTPIDSNKIIGSNRLELKVASKVLFETKGYFTDAVIKNSGSLPMVVGKETTFAIHWQVTSVSNDINGIKIISSLPTGVRWTGNISPSNEKISYNSRTNQIVWDAGEVLSGMGVIEKAREIVFQIGVTPQINQAGNQIDILNKSVLTGRDTFIDQDISLENEKKNTMLYEDPTVGFVNSNVSR